MPKVLEDSDLQQVVKSWFISIDIYTVLIFSAGNEISDREKIERAYLLLVACIIALIQLVGRSDEIFQYPLSYLASGQSSTVCRHAGHPVRSTHQRALPAVKRFVPNSTNNRGTDGGPQFYRAGFMAHNPNNPTNNFCELHREFHNNIFRRLYNI